MRDVPSASSGRALVSELHARMRLPVIVAPMFLISGPEIVVAAGKAGLIGAMPAPNARTIEDLDRWLAAIADELDAAGRSGLWAINMIVHRTYDRYDAELDLICRYKPRIVITALGSPSRPLERIHAYGGAVFADVITPEQARKAVDAGADGLILVSAGAGGHTGKYSPFAFADEVRAFWNGPLILGGGIGGAAAVKATMSLGVDFAYMGTHFIAAKESLVSLENREMLVRARMSDIVTTSAVSGVPANWMRESLASAGFNEDMLKEEKKADFSNLHGDSKAWKTIWGAGHGVGSIQSIQTVAEIVDELCEEYAGGREELARELASWPRQASISR